MDERTAPDAREGLDGVRFAVIDIETTGLRASKHKILQMAAVTVAADGTEFDRWSTYVRPRWFPFVRLGPRHIHGISRRILRNAPPVAVAVRELARRIEGSVLTAHNVAFDMAFVRRASIRSGVRMPRGPEVCTLTLSRSLDPQGDYSHRLSDVCERYGITLDRPHDALADAEATAALLPRLLAAAGVRSEADLASLREPTGTIHR